MSSETKAFVVRPLLFCDYSTFILAGTDTTSNAIAAMLCALSKRPDIQDRLRAELLEAQTHFKRDIPYDVLVALLYLDAFCHASLRL